MSKVFNANVVEAEENLLIDYQFLIQELMTAKGVTRAQLAEKTGLSVARLSQIMSPYANPTAKTLARVVHALGEKIEVSVARPRAVIGARHERNTQWQCFEELGQPDERHDTKMVAVVKRSLNDNFHRNVWVIKDESSVKAA
ncbi:helix-turn-helix domain-containing protein [Tardiphaga sp. 172_B4_N1_3]|uniref:helix-turn-helix domain-containing protein n=1 Tax=Tardiphaga sp. 172_B4_N1_3 TaxID=3240787 RepID=UPI003F8B3D40